MCKNLGRKLNAHTDINAVRVCVDIKLLADSLHPFASASADRNYTVLAGKFALVTYDAVTAVGQRYRSYGGVEEEFYLILKISIDIFKHDIVNIGAQVPYRSIQKVKIVLDTGGLETASRGGVKLSSLSAVAKIDIVDVVHQIKRLLFADILVKRTAEIVCDVIFAVGECACTAEAAHYRAAFTADTAFYLFSVDRTASFA